jgi:hypothetical protein
MLQATKCTRHNFLADQPGHIVSQHVPWCREPEWHAGLAMAARVVAQCLSSLAATPSHMVTSQPARMAEDHHRALAPSRMQCRTQWVHGVSLRVQGLFTEYDGSHAHSMVGGRHFPDRSLPGR